MIIERDKTEPNLYVASGYAYGRPVVAEGISLIDAFTQYLVVVTESCERERDEGRLDYG